MANPQKENGYTSIANEILEALARLNLPSYERRIVDVIIRKTYGFLDKKGKYKIWDRISYSQFEKFTGIRKQHIHRSVLKLLDKNVIERRPISKRGDYEYRLLKDHDRWIGLYPVEVTKDNKTVTHTGYKLYPVEVTKLYPVEVTTKERKKSIKKPSNQTEDSKFEYSEEAERLANLFLKLSGVKIPKSKSTQTLKTWIDSIVKLFRIDGEEYSKIEEVIRWVTTDEFWRKNCLSPLKLRRANRDGTKYFEVFAYNMKPPKLKEPQRPEDIFV